MSLRGEIIFAAMKKILFLGACLVALASQPVIAQTGAADVVVVRVNDGAGSTGHLLIVRGEGKREDVEFSAGVSPNHLGTSGEVMQRVFAKLYQEGYTLKSTFGGSQGYVSTLIFVKEK
ncbi:MAG: hypothetical protein EOO63_00075 [Hymenobacter sp.]|nr:MAG: hypothetical protein EOO63_00075 [Hymenobacter sp.]